MKRPALIVALLSSLITLPAAAAEFACPDLAQARAVNACPTETQLRDGYHGYCSDDSKAYARQTDACPNYEDYRRMKNTALWESGDGAFDAYVSCDLPAGQVAALKPSGMAVARQGSITRLQCSYPNGVTFTYRTRSACRIIDEKACAARPGDCRARCD